MPEVVDSKDLGSGVIGGVECDHLAFRTKDVDWEMWIAQGDEPYPCRYVITSTHVNGAPQYTINLRGWKTGSERRVRFVRCKGSWGRQEAERGRAP